MRWTFFTTFLFLSFGQINSQIIKTGVDVLASNDFKPLQGKRIGLITNPTGANSQLESTIDILFYHPMVNLVALYGPEHGVRGDYSAGDLVDFFIDPKTGLPVYSLYGKNKKPNKEMLKNVDILVYDIQDIGSRSYTYISTLGLAMEAAAENNIKFIVLDRPNPLGGEKIEGMITEKEFTSFVSQFPIPYIHGFTVGELAKFLNGERLLKNGIHCELEIISMKGWKRTMNFEETKLPWIPSSPHIPYYHSCYYYPVSGILGELYVYNIGVGYTMPFQIFAAEWINADSLATNLNNLNLDGVIFRPIHFKPYYSVSKGSMVHGVQVHITDFKKTPLSLLQFYVLQESHKIWPKKNVFELCSKDRISMFDKVCGSDKVRLEFTKRWMVEDIKELWNKDIEEYRKKASKYYIYK